MNILQNDVTGETRLCCSSSKWRSRIASGRPAEFAPYVFQVLSQMLELHKGDAMPQSYVALLPSLLTPTLWQSRGNVPALVRLLQAFLARGGAKIAANNQISPILGIYQQLISSRINDEYGFELLQSLFANVSAAQMDQYKKAVLTLMLTRLQTSKTEKFSRGFIGFVAEWACTQQPEYPDYVVLAFDAVQPG
jgi:exportin-2 (importin alpha re-exporter)